MRGRTEHQDGYIVVTVLLVLISMLGFGLAILSLTDRQSFAAKTERVDDTAFTLAESVLEAQAFLLSRNWPEAGIQTPLGTLADCNAQTVSGGLGTPLPANATASRIQNLVNVAYDGKPATTGATWKVSVCDDLGRGSSWDESLLTGAAYDANGADGAAGSSKRRVWVRAQAVVGGRRSAVAGLVQVNQVPALPANFGLVGGRLHGDVGTATTSVLTGAVAGPVISQLVSNEKLVAKDPSDSSSGRIGLRCGLGDVAKLQLCLAGSLSAVSSTVLSNALGNKFVQFGGRTSASDEALGLLRQQAQAGGTYFPTVAANASCIPTGVVPAGKTIFVEQVGNGRTDTCDLVIPAGSTVSAKALVVGSGQITISGGNANTGGTFQGVVYAANRQRLLTAPIDSANLAVVTLRRGAKVVGGVYADGFSGKVQIDPPPVSMAGLLDSLPLCQNLLTRAACVPLRLLADGPLVNALIPLVGVTPIISFLTPQLAGYGPAIQHSKAVTELVTTYGTSGTVSGTFRQIQPN